MKKNLFFLLCLLAATLNSSNDNKRTFSSFNENNNEQEINEKDAFKKRKITPTLNEELQSLSKSLSLYNEICDQYITMTLLTEQQILLMFLKAIIKGDQATLIQLFAPNTVSREKCLEFMNKDTHSALLTQTPQFIECSRNPLTYAIKHERFEIASFLIDQGASLTPLGILPIVHLIIEQSTPQNTQAIIKLLTHIFSKNPTLIDQQNGLGATPLHCAIEKLNSTLVTFLINKGARVTARTHKKQTGFHLLALACEHDDKRAPILDEEIENIFTVLLNKGLNIEKRDNRGYTALHYASKQGCALLAQQLLSNGADPNSESFNGFSPLQLANKGTKDSNYSIVETLIDYGALVNEREKHKNATTPVQYAIKNNDATTVPLLLSNGAALSIPKDGRIFELFILRAHSFLRKYLNGESKNENNSLKDFLRGKKNRNITITDSIKEKDISANVIFQALCNAALSESHQIFNKQPLKQVWKNRLSATATNLNFPKICTTPELDSLVKKLAILFCIPLTSMKEMRKFPLQQKKVKNISFTKKELELFQQIFKAMPNDQRLALIEKIPGALSSCLYLTNNLQKTAQGCAYNKTGVPHVFKKDMRITFNSYLPLPRAA